MDDREVVVQNYEGKTYRYPQVSDNGTPHDASHDERPLSFVAQPIQMD
jgi:hypothetical protein